MTPTSTWAPGMEHLLAEGEGGVELPSLFNSILFTVHEEGTITIARARQAIERTHANHFLRMRKLYRDAPEDGVDACLRAVLGQMTKKKLLETVSDEEDLWRAGKAFALDKKMHVVTGTSGHRFTVIIPSQIDNTPRLQDLLTQVQGDLRALAQRLEPHGEGLRPVTRAGIDVLKQSLLESGLMRGYPLLYDQHGRLLGGRHRRKVEEELKAEGLWETEEWGESWPKTVITVVDDREAIGIAIAGNRSRPMNADDFKRLEKAGLGSTKRETLRRLIELALLENAARSSREIGNLVGCSHHTVEPVRRALEESGQIAQFEPTKGGRGHTERKKPAVSGEPGHKEVKPRTLPHSYAPFTTKAELERHVESRMDQGWSEADINRELGKDPKGNSLIRGLIAKIKGRWEAEGKEQQTKRQRLQTTATITTPTPASSVEAAASPAVSIPVSTVDTAQPAQQDDPTITFEQAQTLWRSWPQEWRQRLCTEG